MIYGSLVKENYNYINEQEFIAKYENIIYEANLAIEEGDKEVLEEGANIESFKAFKEGRKKFKEYFKASKKCLDRDDKEGYKKNIDKASKVLDDMEKEIKSYKGGATSAVLGIFATQILDVYLDTLTHTVLFFGGVKNLFKFISKRAIKSNNFNKQMVSDAVGSVFGRYHTVYKWISIIINTLDTLLTLSVEISKKKKKGEKITVDDFNVFKSKLLIFIDRLRDKVKDLKQDVYLAELIEIEQKEQEELEEETNFIIQEKAEFALLSERIDLLGIIQEGKAEGLIDKIVTGLKKIFDTIVEKFKEFVKVIKKRINDFRKVIIPNHFSKEAINNPATRFNPSDFTNTIILTQSEQRMKKGLDYLKNMIDNRDFFKKTFMTASDSKTHKTPKEVIESYSPIMKLSDVYSAKKIAEEGLEIHEVDAVIDTKLKQEVTSKGLGVHEIIKKNIEDCNNFRSSLLDYSTEILKYMIEADNLIPKFGDKIKEFMSDQKEAQFAHQNMGNIAVFRDSVELYARFAKMNYNIATSLLHHCDACSRAAFKSAKNAKIDKEDINDIASKYDNIKDAELA